MESFAANRLERALSIRWKLVAIVLIIVSCVVGVAAIAAHLQMRSAGKAAALEAEHVATALVHASRQGGPGSQLQASLESLGKLYERDIVVIDRQSRIVAATNAASLGTVFADQASTLTLIDGQPRTFIGPDVSSPGTARQAAVALRSPPGSEGGPITGAVIIEYTALYDQLLAEAGSAAVLTGVAALVLLCLGILLAASVAGSILRPLGRLREGVAALAAGYYDVRVSVDTHDEIGHLGLAFNAMAEELETSRSALQREVQKQTAAAQRIEYLAYNDSLTTLPNRTMFGASLGKALRQAEERQERLALLFVDLDRFKQINDTLGHAAGDALLKEVATRLRETLRPTDLVARLGGDEFVVLVTALKDEQHARLVADKVVAAIARPFMVAGQELRVTCSVGVSLTPDDGMDEQALMKHADVAMYQAKESGRNCVAFYSAERNANSYERLALEASLRRALEAGELLLHYQPKRDFRMGTTSGMEALLRWRHPELGMVPPDRFIPMAEELGLIVPIGKWVIRQACLQTMAWHARGLSQLTVAVNLSPRQFSDENLLQDVVRILAETGMDGRFLELEITEGAIMQDVAKGRKLLRALKALGIRIAIDDFGTGYSSLSILKQFPIDTLKIDRSFIRDLVSDAEDRGLTEAIIAMGKALKLHIVAEGVETQAQSDFLQERGCDELQGYLFSKPMPADAFEAFAARQPLAPRRSRPASLEGA